MREYRNRLSKKNKKHAKRGKHTEFSTALAIDNLNKALSYISIVQSGKIYRFGLAIRRFKIQCFQTRDKKDFVKWCAGRLLKKNFSAKALREFDDLENVRYCLQSILQNSVIPDIEETEFVRFKKTRKIVIFASVPFFDVGGGQRSAQLAKTFNALGYQVYYIYGFPCTEDNIPDMFIPVNEHKHIDEISREWFGSIIEHDTMVIFEIPYDKFEPYLDIAKKAGCVSIYEHIDNWDSSLGCLFYDSAVFKRFLSKADILTVTAKKLGEKIAQYSSREYIYLPNAVNIEIFEPLKSYKCPGDLKRGRKTLLYFGTLWGEWFEWDKIDYIAGKCPDCEINLIGDYSGCTAHVKHKRRNVHFLGLKKQTELPGYLKYSDFALLPFKNSEIGKFVSPLKIFEYIAMNVRVLATNLDDIKNYPNVYCSDSKEDWVRFLNNSAEELADSSVFISQNNWFARCETLIEKSGVSNKKEYSISIVILNYNNKNVIQRCVDTLLAHNRRYNYEIVVVDNGSVDGSYELLQENYQEKITLVQNTKNGCSSGRNLGVENASGLYICFLDSDQWVLSDYWLDSALKLLESNPQIGAAAWSAGWFAPDSMAGPIVDHMQNRAIKSAKIWYRTDIAYLGTGGLLMKHSLFDEVEGFDEFYDPTCFEDTDLSLKIRNAGYELAYCPYMGIMHLPHQTTQSGSRKHTKLMRRNGEYFETKWRKIKPELLKYYASE